MTFDGTIDDLRSIIERMGRTITSCDDKGNMNQIKTKEGETVNLYKTGTLQPQGNPKIKDKFLNDFHEQIGVPQDTVTEYNVTTAPAPVQAQGVVNGKQIFIVHGHDTTSREQLELILHKLGLDHFVLANTGGRGLTIIEALESKIGQNSQNTAFGIVLMTPDDMGYALANGIDSTQPRARQNVVLEMGMLISSIGRENMAILVKGHLEKPSDADGILYLPFNNHVKETVPRLVDRLKDSGFTIPAEKITHASS